MLETALEDLRTMKLHIYLFRHGQTYFNRDKKFTGQSESRLTPRGVKDAKKVAKKLKNKKFKVAYYTRLPRSKDTLNYVLKYHPECKELIEDDRMIERSYGKLQGMSHKEFIEREGRDDYRALHHLDKIDSLHGRELKQFIKSVGEAELQVVRRIYYVKPPGGESVKDVEKRVKPFIKDLLKKMKKEKVSVAISAHGNSMRPFRKYFEKLTIKDYFSYRLIKFNVILR